MSPPEYRVELGASAQKTLSRLQKDIRQRLLNAMQQLAKNPRPRGVIPLKGQEGEYFRIRVGNWRIIYIIYDDKLLVLVVDVGQRKDIYRNY